MGDALSGPLTAQREWEVGFAHTLAQQEIACRLLELQQQRALEEKRAVVPSGAEVVLAHAHSGEDRSAGKRVLLTVIAKRDLAVVAHHVVGIPEQAADETAAPERRVDAVGDIHVYFHGLRSHPSPYSRAWACRTCEPRTAWRSRSSAASSRSASCRVACRRRAVARRGS